MNSPISECDNSGRILLCALQDANDGEPFGFGGCGQVSVRSDEVAAMGLVTAPDQGGGKLKGVRRAQFVNAQEAFRTIPNLVRR